MQIPRRVFFFLFGSALCSPVFAQARGNVFTGTAPGTARLTSNWARALAVQPDGALWCLVYESDGSGQPSGRHLRLVRSLESGATCSPIADTPTIGDGRGAVAAGRGCDVLHVAWNATDLGSYHDLWYQAFDTSSLSWIGSPTRLLQGTGSNDQYYANDVSVTPQGTLGITFNTHRGPALSGFAPWSGGLFARRRGDPAFQGPYRLNTDSYGMLANLQAIGEVFHASFRTNTGLYGIQYRAFDSVNLQFLTGSEIPLYGMGQSNMRSTNSSSIAADDADNLYVLYSVGSPNPAGGALEVALSGPGTGYGTWTTALVETDAALQAGNFTYQHYGLARGEAGNLYAVFSKASENFQNLYARILAPDPATGGVVVVPDPATTPPLSLVTTGQADAFQRVNGLRAEAARSGLMVVFSGSPSTQPAGIVDFLLSPGSARTVEWGLSCRGSLASLPRLDSRTLPLAGATFAFGVSSAPAGSAGILYAGFDCLRPPFALAPFGFSGCTVFFTPLSTSFFLAGPGGAAPFQIPIPAGSNGYTVQFGAFLLAPGANPGGAVLTNALSASVF